MMTFQNCVLSVFYHFVFLVINVYLFHQQHLLQQLLHHLQPTILLLPMVSLRTTLLSETFEVVYISRIDTKTAKNGLSNQ